jgi:hypothetical protein
MTAAQFNARYPVGTLVRYYPIRGVNEFTATATRSEAWELGSGQAVVSLVGLSGGKSIDHCEVDRDA